jgi:hypothetical protein
VCLERDPLSLVTTIEELLGRKYSGFGLETEITVVGICSADYATPFYPQMFTLTWPRAAVAWSVQFARGLAPGIEPEPLDL